jgi:ubiquinone/menaquinone biosynthesis C-methylase UbiE
MHDAMNDAILREQMRYYRERAPEYDSSILGEDDASADPQAQEFRALPQIIARLTPCEQALELACGTGMWTRHVLEVARNILAVDASPEMIALNRAKVADARVRYQVVDLFAWEPENPVDLAFAAFWCSHVPPERLAPMLTMLRRAVRPGGQLCIIDEPNSSPARPPAAEPAWRELRALRDGRRFQIVKVYYPPEQLTARCAQAGFAQATCIPGTYFFGLIAQ